VGTFFSTTLKLPYLTWFGKGEGTPSLEGPHLNMILGMSVAALLCVILGVWPSLLYNLLPFPVEYNPYTTHHLIESLSLLSGTAVAFLLLLRWIRPHPSITLDVDWFYRRLALKIKGFSSGPLREGEGVIQGYISSLLTFLSRSMENPLWLVFPKGRAERYRRRWRANLLSLGPLLGLLSLFLYAIFWLFLFAQ